MNERIASAEVYVGLNDSEATAGLRRLQAQYHRAMEAIDRERATATVDLDIRPLQNELAKAKRELLALKGKKAQGQATVTIDGNRRPLDDAIKEAEVKVATFAGKKATKEIKVNVDGVKAAEADLKRLNKQEEIEAQFAAKRAQLRRKRDDELRRMALWQVSAFREDERRQKAQYDALWDEMRLLNQAHREDQKRLSEKETAERRLAKLMSDADREEMRREQAKYDALWNEVRLQNSALREDQRRAAERVRLLQQEENAERALAHLQDQAYRMDAERDRKSATAAQEEAVEILNLQKQYSKLVSQREKIARQKPPIGREAHAEVKLDADRVEAQMELIKARLNVLGGNPPVGIKVDLDRSGVRRMGEKLMKTLGEIPNMTMRLGPFTTSIKGAIAALMVFGPILLDVVGALSALIGVMGAGIAGAAAVGGAAMTGFALSIGGTVLAIKPVIAEIKHARQVTAAYRKAVQEHGKDSKEAAKAQDKMNSVLKAIDPNAAKAVRGMDRISKAWEDATGPTRSNFSATFADGIKTVESLLPNFAARTNEFSGHLKTGFKSAFAYLRKDGGQAIDAIQRNFNKATPAMLDGFGGFGEGLLNLLREASKYLPDLMNGFSKMGSNFRKWTQGGKPFEAQIRRWVDSARDLVHFFGAATRVLTGFFGAGVDEGRSMLQTMTAALNRWDKWMDSIEGQESLGDFFSQAVSGTQKLYGALAPLISAFVQWAGNIAPIAHGFFLVIGALGRVLNGFTQLLDMGGVLTTALTTLGATMGLMWSIGKMGAFMSMLSTITLGLGRYERAAKLAASANTLMDLSGGLGVGKRSRPAGPVAPVATATAAGAQVAAAGGKASLAARGFLAVRGAAALAVPAIATMGTTAAVAATGGLALVAGAAVYGAYKLATMETASDRLRKSLKETTDAANNLRAASASLVDVQAEGGTQARSYRDAVNDVAEGKKALAAIEAKHGKNSDQYRAKLEEVNAALNARVTAEDALVKLRARSVGLGLEQSAHQVRQVKAGNDLTNALAEQAKYQNAYDEAVRNGDSMGQANAKANLAQATKEATAAQKAYNAINAAARDASRAATVAQVEYERGLRNLIPLTAQARNAIGKLGQEQGGQRIARSIAINNVDPNDVSRISTQATSALRAGARPKLVLDIVANADNAKAALQLLRAAKIAPKEMRIIEQGGDKAVAVLERILGRRLTNKEFKIAQRGGDTALDYLTSIQGRKLLNKIFAIIARDNASGVLRGVKAELDRINSKTVTMTVQRVEISRRRLASPGAGAGGYSGGIVGFASGGTLRRAHDIASSRSSQTSQRGARITRPTYITGEEGPGHPEYIIASNPAYRRNNLRYWAMAGRALDVPGFAGGGETGKTKSKATNLIGGDVASVQWATNMLGHFRESAGSNSGPELNRLEKEFGMQAAAWCAMFVSKALQKGGLKGVKTASVSQLVSWARSGEKGFQKGVRRSGAGTHKGDVWVDSSQGGHTGLVEKVDREKGIVYTVEGNTTAGKVARRQHRFGEGFTLRPGYGKVEGKAGKGNQIVPGFAGNTYEEKAALLENRIASFGADTDESVQYTTTYIGAQIEKYQMQAERVKDLRDRVKKLNQRIQQPQSKKARDRDLASRSSAIQEIGTLRSSMREITSSVNLSTLARGARDANGKLIGDPATVEMDDLARRIAKPNDLQGDLDAAKTRQSIAKWVWEHANQKGSKVSWADRMAAGQSLVQANSDVTSSQEAINTQNPGSALAELYMAQQGKAMTPLLNSLTAAQVNTPTDFSDDMTAIQPVVSFWTNEWQEAIKYGVQERIDWAAQGLQQAQASAEQTAQALRDQSRAPLDTGLAVAGLSTNLQDDFAATQNLVGWWSNEYQQALASGVQSRIQNAAQMLGQHQQQAMQLARQLQTQPLQAQLALAELTDTFTDDTAAIQGLLGLHEAWLAQAQAIGDHGGIIEQAGQVKQLRDRLKQINESQAQQVGNFNAARLELYRSMGSNAAQPGQAQRVINVTNNYATVPEDPHTWSKSLAFELQAAL